MFEEIIGHNDLMIVFLKAVHSNKRVHILLVDSPASAKTMFLTELLRRFERRPRFMLIDELEKMNKTDQSGLLHLMETGIITETKFNNTRQTELTSRVIATANTCEKIIEPLLSRFLVLEISKYSFEEFRVSCIQTQKRKMLRKALQLSQLKKFVMNLVQKT